MATTTEYVALYPITRLNGKNYEIGEIVTGLNEDQETLLLQLKFIALATDANKPTKPSYGENTAYIEEINKRIDNLSMFRLIADIQGTDFKEGDEIDYSFIRMRQQILLGEYYQKLIVNKTATIEFMGDSMTESYDISSADKRPSSADITRQAGDARSGSTIASKTYPEAVQEYMRQIFGSTIKVYNRGYSGDYIKAGYTRYPNNNDANLTVAMYGTNDARANYVPAEIRGSIEQYIKWYEQLIIRQIMWGKAMIIVAPPKLQNGNEFNIRPFTRALKALGDKYGVPIIRGEEFTANYPYTAYSDAVHFTAEGYKLFASKMVAVLIGEANNPNMITGGDNLLIRPDHDSIYYYGGASYQTNSNTLTPNEAGATTGYTAQWSDVDRGVIYSFYTEEDDIIVMPYFYSANNEVQLTLDFDTMSPNNSNDRVLSDNVTNMEVLPKKVIYNISPSTSTLLGNYVKATGDATQPTLIRIAEKGWHTIKVDSAKAGIVILAGLNFMSFREFQLMRETLQRKADIVALSADKANQDRHLKKLTHSTWAENPTVVTETRIPYTDFLNIFTDLDASMYYRNSAFKITVTNFDKGVLTYWFILPQFSGVNSAGTFVWGAMDDFDGNANVTYERTITNLAWDKTTRELIITWGGTTNRLGNIYISYL